MWSASSTEQEIRRGMFDPCRYKEDNGDGVARSGDGEEERESSGSDASDRGESHGGVGSRSCARYFFSFSLFILFLAISCVYFFSFFCRSNFLFYFLLFALFSLFSHLFLIYVLKFKTEIIIIINQIRISEGNKKIF